MMKYSSIDLKKLQFNYKLTRCIRKILFKNNIWNPGHPKPIPTITSNSHPLKLNYHKKLNRRNNLITIKLHPIINNKKPVDTCVPPIVYTLNATSIVKPHAIEHLRCDVFNLHPDIVILTETWLKPHHSDGLTAIKGYSSFRKDRIQRRGGGVMIYAKENIPTDIYKPPTHLNTDAFETIFLKCTFNNNSHYVCGIYNPPKPIYNESNLLLYIDEVANFMLDNDLKFIIGGDFNRMSHANVLQTGLQTIYYGPTHQGHNLDRLYDFVFTNSKDCSYNSSGAAIAYKGPLCDLRTQQCDHLMLSSQDIRSIFPECNFKVKKAFFNTLLPFILSSIKQQGSVIDEDSTMCYTPLQYRDIIMASPNRVISSSNTGTPILFDLSTYNDKSLSSSAVPVLLYDSYCYDCKEDLTCTKKILTDGCTIKGYCFRNETLKPKDHTLYCNVDISVTAWSTVPYTTTVKTITTTTVGKCPPKSNGPSMDYTGVLCDFRTKQCDNLILKLENTNLIFPECNFKIRMAFFNPLLSFLLSSVKQRGHALSVNKTLCHTPMVYRDYVIAPTDRAIPPFYKGTPILFQISLFNAKTNLSSSVPLLLYDSYGYDCHVDLTCFQKKMTAGCVIDGYYFKDGTINPKNANLYCNVAHSGDCWTHVPGRC